MPPTQMEDLTFSIKLRNIITRIVRETIDITRPKYRYATVQTVDYANGKCDIIFNGETNTVTINMGAIRPSAAGQIVRVEGIGIDRFVADVVGGVANQTTDWVDITPAAGFAILSDLEKPQVRLLNGVIRFQGGFSNTGMAAGTSYTVANVVAPFRPSQNSVVALGSSSGDAVASGFLTSAGDIIIRTSATLGSYYKLNALSGALPAGV